MKLKGATIISLAVFGTLLLLYAVLTARDYTACRNKMTSMAWLLFSYHNDYRHYPSNIVVVASANPIGDLSPFPTNRVRNLLACPGVRSEVAFASNGPIDSDYVYVYWEAVFGTNMVPKDYPIIYDRRLSNHRGLGINVLTATNLFWDFRARWLKGFASKHPEYKIQLPE
jgi:hypothetical protein